ncbi:MAG: ferredoxin [Candidatus Diapherotrites archaeon CG10_big_fil_rev_8_21_14_0_10_31_34]|nr:MAG: ferredoxin [Candidatus Diapherotrites archaeon CG10_big_fil_rev_8_21_14_0_10_31_34]
MSELRFPEYDPEICAYCGACVAVCPALALDLKEKRIVFNKEKCRQCLACTKICPVGALK